MQRTTQGHSPIFIALLSAVLLLLTSVEVTAKEQTVVRFCTPNADVYPFFIFTDQGEVTGINPQILSQVFGHGQLENVAIQYIMRPWKRCDVELRAGTVDMIIGSYNEQRDQFGLYPKEIDPALENSYFSNVEICLTTLNRPNYIAKAQAGLRGETKLTVGVEAGFSQSHGESMVIDWLVIYNYLEKFTLLERGRVDAISEVCSIDQTQIKTKADYAGMQDISTIYEPYVANQAYVVFSEAFATQHADIAKTILTQLDNFDKQSIYQFYQQGKNRAD
ncbi:transporter substrate-binding domain-containing protein [Alteromonas sp. ASW11-36]|uniref:Transporter substrate-binding domain-containing protein n=1 Tax=Alteromonas arenosi TaxID=3055817 RepID=A0ABT7SZI7_9ALTE|nr:transporter substrate-binding domain-containing protein [Alteromonas sp. ASW11-36]MDM7861608.1 transporter substrate-binding domain-containing protein [Alteromonas sp. ASW11-36]